MSGDEWSRRTTGRAAERKQQAALEDAIRQKPLRLNQRTWTSTTCYRLHVGRRVQPRDPAEPADDAMTTRPQLTPRPLRFPKWKASRMRRCSSGCDCVLSLARRRPATAAADTPETC